MPLIDLTLPMQAGMRGFSSEPKHRVDSDGWNSTTMSIYSHAGTHMDAPVHFGVGKQTIDQISLDDCLGPAWLVALDDIQPKTLITVDHLGKFTHQIQSGDAVLLRTGWSQFVDQPQYYRDNFPRISAELAHWLVERKVRLVGVEPPSVADVNDLPEVTEIHHILLGGNVIIVEGLTHLDAIHAEKVLFGAMPLKIVGCDGAPCRAFAIEDATWP